MARCGSANVLDGLVARLISRSFSPFPDQSQAEMALAAAILDEAHCPGARGFWEDALAKLKKIAAPFAPRASKP
jgi:hypothetical protein